MQLAHCDIRQLNILLDWDNHAKLADFDTISHYGEIPAIPVAPDWAWYDLCCGPRHDLFGIGDTLWELYTEKKYDWGTPEDPRFPPDTTGVQLGHVISKCWNSEYPSISDLAKEAEFLHLEMVCDVFAPTVHRSAVLLSLLGERILFAVFGSSKNLGRLPPKSINMSKRKIVYKKKKKGRRITLVYVFVKQ
ncbi:MAG: hypothetical protein Q9170_007543 [Blastenia crenularia]